MSDQGLSEAENSPGVAGPEGTPGTPEQATPEEVDWQKRYVDTQEAYTKGQQELADLRQQQELHELLLSTDDPDVRREVAEALGYQLDEDDTQAEADDDPLAHYDERLGRIEAALTHRQEEELSAQEAAEVRAVVDERLNQLTGLDRDDQDWVLAYAINALPPTDEGLPDVGQAFSVFQAREDARQKRWAQTKRAPHIAPHGQAATEVPNLDNRQERWDYMTRRLQENEQ